MERYRFGLGEYKYFDYPLPKIIQTLRETIYPKLSPIANLWMKVLNIDKIFPEIFEELQSLCHQNNQLKPTPLILKYEKGGFNTLHQDLYGDKPFDYTYSKITKSALPWTKELLELKEIIENKTGEKFNSCLLNLYHNGDEGMAWHSDGEKDLKKMVQLVH